MRAPKRRRPLIRAIAPAPQGKDLNATARRATYIGSPEHKDTPSFAGQPRPRADAALCDRSLAQQQTKVLKWLRAAIRHGSVSALWEGDFPRYVWHREGTVVFEARLVNQGNGQYKGYPLNPEEWPQGLKPQ
jgi:hypothetical protein